MEGVLKADNAVAYLGLEAVHNAEDDDQRRHADGHSGDGDVADQRDEASAPLGLQISRSDEEFVGHFLVARIQKVFSR